jgi:hypothetical protein
VSGILTYKMCVSINKLAPELNRNTQHDTSVSLSLSRRKAISQISAWICVFPHPNYRKYRPPANNTENSKSLNRSYMTRMGRSSMEQSSVLMLMNAQEKNSECSCVRCTLCTLSYPQQGPNLCLRSVSRSV